MAMHGIQLVRAKRFGARLGELFTGKNAARCRSLLIMALCSRARVGPGLAPFAAAYFAAELRREDELPGMLLGCALGSFVTGFDGAALYAPAACALALIFHLALDFVAAKLPRFRLDAASRASLIAGLSVLLPGLTAAGYAPGAWLMALAAAICAALLAPVLTADRVWWSAQVKLGAAACAMTLCCAGLNIDPVPVAALCALTAASAGRGALTGAALGLICAFAGGGAAAFSTVCLMGAAADLAPRSGPSGIWRALAGAAAYGALALWLEVPFSVFPLTAAALHALLPQSFIARLCRACAPPARRDGRLLQALRRRDEKRLRALSDAFSTLSEACGAGDPAFGEQQLITRMRAALCAGCAGYERCWPGANSGAVKLFCQLMTAAIECGGSPFRNGEVPPDIMRLCRRGMTVPNRLGSLLADFAAQRHRRIRLMEARRLIAGQFDQAAAVINAMAAEQARPFIMRDGAAAHVHAALADAGIPVRDVMALKLDALEITVELAIRWSRELMERAARVITAALDRPFSAANASGKSAVFSPGGLLRAEAVYSALPADPDHPCGDSCLIRELGGGQLFVALSDGMGSGEAAAEESLRVTTLMHSLVSAGMPRELAASTVNGVLLSRGGEELFATADMLLVDLETGRAEFTKLAASRSYIVRGGEVITVEGGRLPLGILDEVRPGVSSTRLRRGDVVFMMTDGVSDALSEAVLSDLMLSAVRAAPKAMAEVLINAAAARAPGRRDDMTAVCVSIA